MFFEKLDNRQMFSVGLSTTAVVTLPKLTMVPTVTVSIAPATAAKTAVVTKTDATAATTPAPSQGTVLKAGTNPITSAIDPSKLGISQVGVSSPALQGGVSTNPTDRPSAADLAAANSFRSFVDSTVNGALEALAAQYGKTFSQITSLTNVIDPTGGDSDFLNMIMADMQAQTGTGNVGTVGGIDSRYADGDDVPGGLGINPTDGEVAAAIKAKQTGTTTTAPAATGTSNTDAAKDAGETLASYLLDVVVEKFGPPGPATTILEAPGFVEKVTGDARDLLNGFIAIFNSGDKDPRTSPKEMTSPDGDVTLEPQQQKVIDQMMLSFAGMVPPATPFGTNLISQPVRGDDSSVVPLPDKDQLTASKPPAKDMSPYINPGSGDDGNVPVGDDVVATRTIVGVKDPANPSLGTDGPGIAPPTSGLTPGGPTTTPTTGVKPTNPK